MSTPMVRGQIQSIKTSWSNALISVASKIEEARKAGDEVWLAQLKKARSDLIEDGWIIHAAEQAMRARTGIAGQIGRLQRLAEEARKVTRGIDEAAKVLDGVAKLLEIMRRLLSLVS